MYRRFVGRGGTNTHGIEHEEKFPADSSALFSECALPVDKLRLAFSCLHRNGSEPKLRAIVGGGLHVKYPRLASEFKGLEDKRAGDEGF